MYIYFNTETNKTVSSERFDQIIEDFAREIFNNDQQFHVACINDAVDSLYNFPCELWNDLRNNIAEVTRTINETAWDIAKENATDLLFVDSGGVWIESEVEDV